jgi:transcriptional regulator with XRE-family HTH domain
MMPVFSPQLNRPVKSAAKPLEVAASYAPQMDVTSTRLANLKLLASRLRRRGHLTNKQIAVELDMSASFFSQLLGGKKMGDDVARKLEIAQALQHGWMDVQHPLKNPADGKFESIAEPEAEYDLSQSLRMEPEIIAASIKLVRLTFETLDFEHDPEEDGVPLAFAYEYLSKRRERVVTPENLVDFRRALSTKLMEQQKIEDTERTGISRSTGRSDRVTSQRSKTS